MAEGDQPSGKRLLTRHRCRKFAQMPGQVNSCRPIPRACVPRNVPGAKSLSKSVMSSQSEDAGGKAAYHEKVTVAVPSPMHL